MSGFFLALNPIVKMNYEVLFSEIHAKIKEEKNNGKVAGYIPELKLVDPSKFGANLIFINGGTYNYGDALERFSIQSISKVFSLVLAYKLVDEKLWKRVGVEPSGTAFNSLIQLEYEKGIPRNPFINAGAIVISDILITYLKHPKDDFLAFVRKLANNETINYSHTIAKSEKEKAYTNYALIHLMKSFKNIKNDIEEVMDFYFHLCSIKMNCEEISKAFLFLANDGKLEHTNEQILTKAKSKRINSIMQLCGFYDEAGEFAFRVGLPGKSGVGGGIVALYPNRYCISVWSPKLNAKGNSFLGTRFLEVFTTEIEESIF